MLKKNNDPLVSIIVITYNSAKYVLQTLESAKAQSYQNIELIVSDDCSTDDTVELCRQWIEEHKDRFVRTKIINIEKNTGIPANCNRGVQASGGNWIKIIAGDDILLKDCIYNNVQYILNNPGTHIVLSNVDVFYSGKKSHITVNSENIPVLNKCTTPKLQKKWLLLEYFGKSPSFFINEEIFKTITFDEEYRLLEDYPFAINVVNHGFSFSYLNKSTVKYRIHNDSVQLKNRRTKNSFYETIRAYEIKHIYPNINTLEQYLRTIEYYRQILMDASNVSNKTLFYRIIYYTSEKISPYFWYKRILFKRIKLQCEKQYINNAMDT